MIKWQEQICPVQNGLNSVSCLDFILVLALILFIRLAVSADGSTPSMFTQKLSKLACYPRLIDLQGTLGKNIWCSWRMCSVCTILLTSRIGGPKLFISRTNLIKMDCSKQHIVPLSWIFDKPITDIHWFAHQITSSIKVPQKHNSNISQGVISYFSCDVWMPNINFLCKIPTVEIFQQIWATMDEQIEPN